MEARITALMLACAMLAMTGARAQGAPQDPLAAVRLAAAARGVDPTAVPVPDASALHAALAATVGADPPAARALEVLLPAVAQALALRAEALREVGDDEIAFARRVAEHPSPSPPDVARAVAIVERIDIAAMTRGATIVLEAVERAAPALAKDGPATPVCTPGWLVCVGSAGDDVYTHDAMILLDPGGDDLYLNNAGGVLYRPGLESTGGCAFGGGTTGRARPDLGCTSAPSSVCTYDTLNNAAGTQGLPVTGIPGHDDPRGGGNGADGSCGSDARREAAIAALLAQDGDADAHGFGLLVDLDGSDTYTVPWSHEDPLFGLIEACFPGRDDVLNTNRDLFQGSALGGIGILWDRGDGDDIYRGRLNAQGSGHVGGVGLLLTDGTGDATFWADRLSQGNGIAGGIGVLANAKDGTHTYLLDPPVVYRNEFGPAGRECAQEGRAGQGQGGFAGAGVLWNVNEGDAVYRAVLHATQDAFPYAPVLDEHGRPVLRAGTDAQGSGESFPIVDTPGGVVLGAGLLVDDTDGDASVCPASDGEPGAGMSTGSGPDTGVSLASMGTVDRGCGTFNLPSSVDPAGDLGLALQRLLAGAVGVRVVL